MIDGGSGASGLLRPRQTKTLLAIKCGTTRAVIKQTRKQTGECSATIKFYIATKMAETHRIIN
jgi:hypothetical protein